MEREFPGTRRRPRLPWFRLLAIVAAAAAMLWVSVGVTLTFVLGEVRPDFALSVWPGGAASAAALSMQKLAAGDWEGARAAARSALNREPVNVEAARALGLLAARDGDQPKAARLFAYAESLSRRDVPTQLWLIEDSVGRNDISAALRHYDRAMRTSPASRGLLVPILVSASASPDISRPLAELVASRPNWWNDFVDKLVSAPPPSPPFLALLLSRLHLDPGGDDRWLLSKGLNRLVQAGAYNEAYQLYRQSQGSQAGNATLLRDGGFSAARPVPPFDWELYNDPGVTAAKEPRPGVPSGSSLSIAVDPGMSGPAARQLLLLAPGAYRLTATVGDSPAAEQARPKVSVACVGDAATQLATISYPAAVAGPAPLELRFQVPAQCPAQWLRIDSGVGADQSEVRPWISAIALSPAASSAG